MENEKIKTDEDLHLKILGNYLIMIMV